MCGKGCRCTHKAVHAPRGAHRRHLEAILGVLLFQGGLGRAPALRDASILLSETREVHKFFATGLRCTHKAICNHRRNLVI